ncbi:sulfatase-like hydrolase/transferase [Spirosoma soli]|uniref:Sulfatase-like hydrolase/transferase n=1 Tax=Spirosoma soli TaxID=1770529 RepID=A0ABW5M8C5_9BACT
MHPKKPVPSPNALPQKPNLLFIITDQDRGLMHFPPGWEEQNLTAMPRLRKNGLTFTQAFCSTCMCSPSRATLFTGLFPPEHSVILTLTQDMTYSDKEPELATDTQNMSYMLSASGYNVSYIGKWHLSKDTYGGFDNMVPKDMLAYGFSGWIPPDAGEDVAPEHFGGGRANRDLAYVNQAINFLYNVQQGNNPEPFALFLSLVNPHDVLAFPKDWREDYAPEYLEGDIQLPATVHEDLSHKPTVQQLLVPYLAEGLGPLPTDEMKRQYLNFYGNLIAHTDAQINSVLDVLYQVFDTATGRSLADSTIVVRTADHGEMGMTHNGMRQKIFNAYEETMSVPMVISNPVLFPHAQVSNQFFSLVDMMPTIDGLLKLGNPLGYTFRGCDLSPVIRHPQTSEVVQDAILFTFDDFRAGNGNEINPLPAANRIRCIREERWKYAYYFYIAPPEQDPPQSYPREYEMYDLHHDPNETHNLANPNSPLYNDSVIAAERERLHRKLLALEEEKLGAVTMIEDELASMR